MRHKKNVQTAENPEKIKERKCYGKVTKSCETNQQALERCRSSPSFQMPRCWLGESEQNMTKSILLNHDIHIYI